MKLGFEILFDNRNAYARSLDLVHGFDSDLRAVYQSFGIDVGQANGDSDWQLPMPARIVVDNQHRIKSIDVHADYTTRPDPDATLNIVLN